MKLRFHQQNEANLTNQKCQDMKCSENGGLERILNLSQKLDRFGRIFYYS
jgi:hypothetical protein